MRFAILAALLAASFAQQLEECSSGKIFIFVWRLSIRRLSIRRLSIRRLSVLSLFVLSLSVLSLFVLSLFFLSLFVFYFVGQLVISIIDDKNKATP